MQEIHTNGIPSSYVQEQDLVELYAQVQSDRQAVQSLQPQLSATDALLWRRSFRSRQVKKITELAK